MKKVLVGITIQENSRRLIQAGHELAKKLDAPLAILHIKKGNSIFENPSDSTLFEELFAFGKELGGEAHFLCSNDIVSTLLNFIQEEGVTDLVVGAAPPPLECGETPLLPPSIEHVTIHIVDRLKI